MPIIVDTPGVSAGALQLCALWLNLASDPADNVALPYVASMTPGVEAAGSVRTMANGRRRMVRRAGRTHSCRWALSRVDRDQIQWLEEHVGELMCVRDDRGRKWYGVYLTAPVEEHTWTRAKGVMTLDITQVTHTEAV